LFRSKIFLEKCFQICEYLFHCKMMVKLKIISINRKPFVKIWKIVTPPPSCFLFRTTLPLCLSRLATPLPLSPLTCQPAFVSLAQIPPSCLFLTDPPLGLVDRLGTKVVEQICDPFRLVVVTTSDLVMVTIDMVL
jgi:hypothetical protein